MGFTIIFSFNKIKINKIENSIINNKIIKKADWLMQQVRNNIKYYLYIMANHIKIPL